MAKTFLFPFRRSLTRDRRLGIALMGSALLHALTLLTLANYSIQSRAFTRPVFAPLSVQLDHLTARPAEKPVAVIRKKAVLPLNPSALPATAAPPADIEASLPEPGVSIVDTLYLKPIGARVSSQALMSGEFRRSSEISEVPLMLRMRAPSYPREARKQKLSGWVTVMFLVNEQGQVVETAAVDASESFGDLEADVAAQMRDSTFTPGKLDGRAVKALVFALVRFDAKALSLAGNSLAHLPGSRAGTP